MKGISRISDEQLLERGLKGDKGCINVLITRHSEGIKCYIRRNIKRTDVVDDVFQDVCLKVFSSIVEGKYRESGRFLPWVMRIAYNISMDYYRGTAKNVVKIGLESEYDFSNMERGVGDLWEDSVEENIVNIQRAEELSRLVKCLPENQRKVIEMRHYANMSFKEIAEETNVGINTALGRFKYGIDKLRMVMMEKEKMCV